MHLKDFVQAGTLESSDLLVSLEALPGALKIELESPVLAQFGEEIEASVREVLQSYTVESGLVRIQDRGALDCTIRARVGTALERAITLEKGGHCS